MSERAQVTIDNAVATVRMSRPDKLNALDADMFEGGVCVVAAPEGVRALTSAHPEVPIYAAALDRELNGQQGVNIGAKIIDGRRIWLLTLLVLPAAWFGSTPLWAATTESVRTGIVPLRSGQTRRRPQGPRGRPAQDTSRNAHR